MPVNSVLISCTATVGKVNINKFEITTNQQINAIVCNKKVIPEYLAYYLKTQKENIENLTANSGVKHVNLSMLDNFKIPLPPKEIQEKIVREIEKIEKKEGENKKKVKKLKDEVNKIIEKTETATERRLGDVVTTQYGFTEKAEIDGEIRYLRITDLNDDGSIKLDNDKVFINPSVNTRKQFLLNNNDIVIARSGSVGKSAIYKSDKYEKMIFASYLIRVSADLNKILPQYLFYYTQTKFYWEQVNANLIAVTQPNLNAEKIKSFKISLPTLSEQQKIVVQIEKIEQEIEVLQLEIENSEMQKKNVLKKYL